MGIVYCAINSENGKAYIGKSIYGLANRRSNHESACDRGVEYHLYRAMRKHGKDAFVWRVLDEAQDNELADLEMVYIDLFNTYRDGYNMTMGGEGTIGFIPTSDTREKMSKAHRGNKNGLGVKMTEENRRKLAERMTGNQYTTGKASPRKGIPRSEEVKRKISDTLKGRPGISRPISEETKRKISDTLRGRPLTDEHRKKLRESNKDNAKGKRSGQALENIRNAQRARRERERMEKEQNGPH